MYYHDFIVLYVQHPLLQRAAIAARVGGSRSPTSLASDSEDRSDSEVILRFRKESVLSNDKVEEAEEEELGPMFPQRSKLLPMNPLKQVRLYFDIHRPDDSSISSSHQRRRLMEKRCWTRMMMMRLRLWTMRVLGMRWRMTMR